ncbi:MAG: tetratricopeptide repeat protein [Acidobacteria bacterium]|nr:tetratricopeptide repeat protein [Acidobacteriota bacterium]
MSPRLLLLLAPLLALAPSAIAQEGAEEQAQRLLEDGRAYREQGKLKQALDNFNIVISSFAGTDAVGQAWLEIGRYRMEVEGDEKGAREAFEQVSREHAQSDAAPGAYHYLGLLTLEGARTPGDLDDALAQFARVETLYPQSPWVPRSLQASALVDRRAGRYDDAVALNRRVALEYPASDAAPRAQFEAGHVLALQGKPRIAMEEFQQVRNRFPESPWAERALERITALYRLHATARPVFTLDSGFSVAGGNVLKDVQALLVTPDRRLWIASKKTKSAVAFDPSGKMGESLAGQEPRTLSLAPDGRVVFAAESAVRIGLRDIRTFFFPPEKQGEERKPLEKIRAAAVAPGGSILVSDEKNDTVFRFGVAGELLGPFFQGAARESEVTRIVVDGERGIYLLDGKEKMVAICDEGGRTLRTIGPSGLRKPSDIAVDPFRNVYVADEDEGVLVFDPQGQPFFKITGPEMKKPTAITLDATGAVLVYDDGSDRVLRYR